MALRCSCSGLALLDEVKERMGNLRETLNKPIIKVPKAKEGLNVLDVSRFWPLYNTSNLDGVHAKCVVRDDKSQEFD